MNEQQAIQVLKGFGLDALVQNDGSYRVFNGQGLEQSPIPNINALISRAGYLQSTRPVPQPVGRFWGGRPMLAGASQPGAITRGLTVLPRREEPSDPMTTEQLRAITPELHQLPRGNITGAQATVDLENNIQTLNKAKMTVTPTRTGTYIVVDNDRPNDVQEMTVPEIAVMASEIKKLDPLQAKGLLGDGDTGQLADEDPLPDIFFQWSVLARTPQHTAGVLSGTIADPDSRWMVKREDGRVVTLTSAAMLSEELAAISQLLQGVRPTGGLEDNGKVLAADTSQDARDYIAGQVPGALPPLAAIPENVDEGEQRARNAEAISGVPHEVYVEGGQILNRPVEVEEDFRPRFAVDDMDRTIVQMSPGGQWSVVEPETPLTKNQQIDKLVSEGKYDEAAKLDQIYDQLNEERLTPERAAEMLVGISYSPSDFKAMMDAMLGEDSQLDTTVDIGALQEQASAMLRGEVPAAQTVSQMPPFEPPPVFPVPTPFDDRAVDLDKMYVEQAGNIPYIENLLFQQGEQDALMEEGLAPEVVSAPPEQPAPVFTAPEPNRGLPREIAAIGASAMASADRAAMERAAQDEEIRIIQNTPFTSTKEKLKAMEEVMGPRAALYMRNQRLLQPQQQQLFEASRPLTRRYV